MRFVFRSPAGSVFAVHKATRREAVATSARIVPGATYLGPVAPHMVPAIIAAKPATPEELRVMRRVLPAEPASPCIPAMRSLAASRRALVVCP